MIKGLFVCLFVFLSFNPLECDSQCPDTVFFSVIRVEDKEIYLLALNENKFGYVARFMSITDKDWITYFFKK